MVVGEVGGGAGGISWDSGRGCGYVVGRVICGVFWRGDGEEVQSEFGHEVYLMEL